MITNDFNKEQLAGYISSENIVYSFAPDYIQKMAKEVNEDYRKFYNADFFSFENAKDMFGDEPPDYIKKIRQELEEEYIK